MSTGKGLFHSMDTEERKNDKMLFSLLRKLRKSTKLVDN